jgi:hypothetical protein
MKKDKLNKIKILALSSLILTMTGCYSIEKISKKDIRTPLPNGNIAMVFTSDTAYLVTDLVYSEEGISGIITDGVIKKNRPKGLHIYVAPADAITKEGNRISFQYANIAKVEKDRFDFLKMLEWLTLSAIAIIFAPLIIGGGYDM